MMKNDDRELKRELQKALGLQGKRITDMQFNFSVKDCSRCTVTFFLLDNLPVEIKKVIEKYDLNPTIKRGI